MGSDRFVHCYYYNAFFIYYQVRDAHDALEYSQRANVAVSDIKLKPQKDYIEGGMVERDVKYDLYPVWENFGSSATINLKIKLWCDDERIVAEQPRSSQSGLIAPKQLLQFGRCELNLDDIRDRLLSKQVYKIKAKAVYEDIFGRRRITDACYIVEFIKIVYRYSDGDSELSFESSAENSINRNKVGADAPGRPDVLFSLSQCAANNCMDDACKYQ